MLARLVWSLVLASIAVALVATIGFVVATLPVRIPYWGEAEVVFEASRLRSHLPLYVDPLVGAHEYGDPASRFFVTYPPVWTWVVSLAPKDPALLFARVACTVAWFGSLGWLAWTAPRASRREAAIAAAFVAGIWVLANFATVGRPDSIACAIAAGALARTIRRDRIDLVGVALFVLVPWVKPTLIGLPLGALAGAFVLARGRTAAERRHNLALAGATIALVIGSAATAYVASGGALFTHVVRSNAQPFTWSGWSAQVPSRLPFFAPLFGWALWVGWRDRARPGTRIGLAALVGAIVWTVFALAKTGSASNYWMEPAIAAVALLARATPTAHPFHIGGTRLGHAVVALGCVAWADVASVRGAIEHASRMRGDAALVDTLRSRSGIDSDGVVAADEAGIELVVNGRILTPTYQMVHLVRRGSYPAALWIS
ncbi:MAG: hypothetical protein K0S65_2434, partial [Labilithrix sp.]|nr:hypothetical protein [Labilithrix sp.]